MRNATGVLDRLDEGDRIRFRSCHDGIGERDAEVIGKSSLGVKIELDEYVGSFGTTAWIEYDEHADGELPILLGTKGISPDATVHCIEIDER